MTARRLPIALAVVLALLFLADAAAMHLGATYGLDHRLLAAWRKTDAHRSLLGPAWDLKLIVGITTLGAGLIRMPVTILAALTLAQRGRGRDAAILVGAVAGGALLLPVLKTLFDRPRPDLIWHLVVETNRSFPSGHAMGAMILYPLLGLLLGHRATPTVRHLLVAIGMLVALSVGTTRVILGVHWASDVLGGWLIGGACLAVASACVRAAPSRSDLAVGRRAAGYVSRSRG